MNKIEDYSIDVEELINKRRNSIKEFTSVINNDKPIFEKQDFEIIEGEPKYFEPDEQIKKEILETYTMWDMTGNNEGRFECLEAIKQQENQLLNSILDER